MYDLPVGKRSAVSFMKNIKKLGYMRVQKSVYVKLLRNKRNVGPEINAVREIRCLEGDIKILPMQLDVFKKIVSISGDDFELSYFANDVVVI